jgi:hypothetical protein
VKNTFPNAKNHGQLPLAEELPPYFPILTTWGVRPEWDEKSENIFFLNGSGEVERLADFSTRYSNKIKSDNPVVNKDRTIIAHQFGFQKGAGHGRGIFLFDLKAYSHYKTKK